MTNRSPSKTTHLFLTWRRPNGRGGINLRVPVHGAFLTSSQLAKIIARLGPTRGSLDRTILEHCTGMPEFWAIRIMPSGVYVGPAVEPWKPRNHTIK